MNPKQIDQQHIADALWLDTYDVTKIPEDLKSKINSEKNSPRAFGQRMGGHLDWLLEHTQSFTPSYKKRYQLLRDASEELTPQQAYIIRTNFLGRDASQGYDKIPPKANLQFPRDHEVKMHSQIGWHFFVGSVWGEDGQEYGVELMFFGAAILPPELAKAAGLSDIENQIYEVQLGISKAGERHHQADPIVIAGTSGLLSFSNQPFTFKLGKNEIVSKDSNKFFPLELRARGVDREKEAAFELGVDLKLNTERGILYQGDDGCMPSLAGFGTLYYSIPNIKVEAGSTITYGDKQVKLKQGLMWFDHQWGFLGGNPNSEVLRASMNMSPSASGWDWYMAQFKGNRQVTMFATHSNALKQYYFQDGPKPPDTMKVTIAGKYMDEQGELHNTWGKLTIDRWAQATISPNPELYPVTKVWHPDGWKFSFDEVMPEDIRHFSMEQIVPVAQTNFFANGAQYNEGAVYLKNPRGESVGRGFAEAVSYADTSRNTYRLANIEGNKKLTDLLQKQTASLPLRVKSFLYVLRHQKELKTVLENSAGMEFMGPAPKTKKQTHKLS